MPSSSFTGVIWPSNRPSSIAAAAFSCEDTENSSSWARDCPQRSAIISAPIPWLGATPWKTVWRLEPDGFTRTGPIDEPIGTRLIDSTPPATTRSYWPLTRPAAAKWTDCWLEPHWRSTVTPGTDCGQPAAEHGAAGDVERLLADLADAAPDHVVDLGRVGQPGALRERVEHVRRQVHRVNPGQRAVPLSYRRPNRRHDHRVAHGAALLNVEFSLLPTTSGRVCPFLGQLG